MVKHISSFGRNGVHDYLLIRATGIIMALYTVYMMCFFAFGPDINYLTWHSFFGGTVTKVFTMIALLCVLVHAWIGLWQVLTDYVKPALIRSLLQLAVIVTLVAYFFSGLFILWGV
ncbi:succinate dehydrogenase, hydrophobic membrane anchor protein [Vibrio rumoiensis]|uniref:Succinate dehydrogenase hydrophobic membrane anchor subunit n=1 Tax=Vibrio rumoiensis 1S-45 TaxID=1188252 RepID=A0A1E5E0S1_9VIBR|nr:succinate dehydrogenase, hydrophobic membrane anchor protein [Vibrio rumoiensis]OEF24029.1 succinate dehydrogenase, hydrophobic membrane anchor protein [Vibrio rumoiensis 1S-45]